MVKPLLVRLQELELCPWENGEVIARVRNPDGIEAAGHIMNLEAKLHELEEEIAALDLILEQNAASQCLSGEKSSA